MTRDELLAALRAFDGQHGPVDPEAAHGQADQLLLNFINDPEVTEAFERIEKWYA